VPRVGFGHNSRLAIARLGHDPASRFFEAKNIAPAFSSQHKISSDFVPRVGFEPTFLAELDLKSSAATNYATRASEKEHGNASISTLFKRARESIAYTGMRFNLTPSYCMMKRYWPRGEEATRRSAKPLCEGANPSVASFIV
jgi:hypothetical protein